MTAVRFISSCLLAGVLAACAPLQHRDAAEGDRARLAILESTDVHSNVLGYDYDQLAEDDNLGFDRLATLVRQARLEFPNTLLFDVGDTIQGTALADYQAGVAPPACNKQLAMYRAMDVLGYDGGTLGNHEFNYGLTFLSKVTGQPMPAAEPAATRQCKGPAFPLVLSNVLTNDGRPLYPPYLVLDRRLRFSDARGREREAPIRIGLLGFTPPPILQWDKRHLDGNVRTLGVVEAARKYLPELQARNVDVVIALSHGGIDASAYSDTMENANWHLAQVPGIDVLLLGHSHTVFPDPGNSKSRFANLPEVDNARGFVHGKPAVMGNFWGKSLGLIDLALVRKGGRWIIDAAATQAEVRSIRDASGTSVRADPAIAAAVEREHRAVIDWVSQPIGSSDFAMTSYFAELGDVTALQVVNEAQRSFAEHYIATRRPDLSGIPILSAAAPFKSGFGGANDYTDVPAGPLAIRHASALYLYPNTLAIVRIDGATLKAWLERSAERFNRIDPSRREPQELINRKMPGYNFDVIQGGLTYRIDVTRERGQRIVELHHDGKSVTPEQSFLVATNNYRATDRRIPGLGEAALIHSAKETNRDVLIEWIRRHSPLTRHTYGSDRNWCFATIETAGPVLFTTAAHHERLAIDSGIILQKIQSNDEKSTAYKVKLKDNCSHKLMDGANER